ncbi:hypothetical protein I6A60_29345 [Frankia sp. AgB1.9]|uniref:hypothetical protein n=1 Tax=unclassified Frankia TaxID=2632575 RepID=UPI0019312519|nr:MULTISPECIES: hypothetical protein [unclassified Frankia]MBL7489725.1 hypothetical protein [Frankia sp. AgW1.1]MBL7551935.1 hypothetical protein [Frankia sp. AgB1.9]MBL7623226.1 hypothetical protein [Frankia sp. AgB1.8]
MARSVRLGGEDAVDVEVRVPWLRLPVGTAGLLIRRQPGLGGGGRSGPVARHVRDGAGVEFRAVTSGGLWPAALAMCQLPHVRHVVVFPVNGSPSRAALAIAVGDLLTRPSQTSLSATVVCGTEPPTRGGLNVVRHEVVLTAPGGSSDRVVWQILTAENHPRQAGDLDATPPTDMTAGPPLRAAALTTSDTGNGKRTR